LNAHTELLEKRQRSAREAHTEIGLFQAISIWVSSVPPAPTYRGLVHAGNGVACLDVAAQVECESKR
jgi:hypothetical protein